MSNITVPAIDDDYVGLLSRERTRARPSFNRWLVPPAALAIHLSIGMAYGFSVFWLPMTRLVPGGVTCTNGFFNALTATGCNWSVAEVTPVFETFIAMLGISAALWGSWVEHVGPRKSGMIAAACWGGGLVLGGFGVSIHQLWLVYLGCGLIGGVGQGLGYITPVSTLIKWFPDRRGMATGLAIMGYGGGAMIGAPLAVQFMSYFSHGSVPGVAKTLSSLGLIYLFVMALGAFGFRVAPPGWRPRDSISSSPAADAMITPRHVHLRVAWRTPQFWLLWGVLCLNVTAGIAVISMASPMLQEVFGGQLLGLNTPSVFSTGQRTAVAAAAAGLVGLISLFNSVGRFFWASASDYLGRKNTYFTFFGLGIMLYALLPTWGHLGQAPLFVISICLILSMYGGGFATAPAYLADLFGTQMVGAIHGRLITAWSVAGVVGPVLITTLRETQLKHGVVQSLVYDRTLYVLAGVLLLGFICNFFIRPVGEKNFMTEEQLRRETVLQNETHAAEGAGNAARGRAGVVGIVAWLAVGVPFLIGLYIALEKAAALF
jgi:MFS family permease